MDRKGRVITYAYDIRRGRERIFLGNFWGTLLGGLKASGGAEDRKAMNFS